MVRGVVVASLLFATVARADDELPKLALARPSIAKVAQSEQLNAAGYKLHAEKKYVEAGAKYRAAVVADPGNLLARYNYASMLVSSGKVDAGIAILAHFAVPDCRACVGILLHSTTDAEWKAARDVAAYQVLVKDLKVDAIDQKKLAQLAADLVETVDQRPSSKPLAPYFHPRLAVRVMIARQAYAKLETLEEFDRWNGNALAEKNPIIHNGALTACKNNCCTFGSNGSRSDTVWQLDSVCFAGVGGILFLDAITFSSYLSSFP